MAAGKKRHRQSSARMGQADFPDHPLLIISGKTHQFFPAGTSAKKLSASRGRFQFVIGFSADRSGGRSSGGLSHPLNSFSVWIPFVIMFLSPVITRFPKDYYRVNQIEIEETSSPYFNLYDRIKRGLGITVPLSCEVSGPAKPVGMHSCSFQQCTVLL